MDKYKVIIIDDERLAIDVLKNYLLRLSNFELLESFTNPIEAISYLKNNKVDLVFSDINMPNILGTEIVKLMKDTTKFIMVTSHSEYAIESFELEVVDYLLKPVPFERFNKAINRFINDTNTSKDSNRQSFFIKEGNEYNKIFIDDIDYIEGLKDYAKIHCGKDLHLILKTLKSLEEILNAHDFIRVHKSFIIPLHKITNFNGRFVEINNNKIPIGANHRKELVEYLNDRKL